MDRNRSIVLVTLAALVVTLACNSPGAKVAAGPTQEEKIARGKALSYSVGCVDCHTPGGLYGAPDTTRMLSGSELGWEGPWGVTYPRNLTPDPETGIATWSEKDIVIAIREGRRPDGTPILPPMPWPGLAHLSDDEAYAIAAFIKSLPPIVHKSPDRGAPGAVATGARLTFPPPPAWDAQHLPPPAAAPPATGTN